MMQSAFGDKFNHDPWANEYDRDVANESDPIRTGYDATLAWVIDQSGVTARSRVLDLGCGTGNLSRRLNDFDQLICVDISAGMLDLARQKLAHAGNVTFVQADLLGYFEQAPEFDVVMSTYAIHHLTGDEKRLLFAKINRHLRPGGRAVFGDLMFADEAARGQLVERFTASGQHHVIEAFDEEFFWFVDEATAALTGLGFEIETARFSDLSWGICAIKG